MNGMHTSITPPSAAAENHAAQRTVEPQSRPTASKVVLNQAKTRTVPAVTSDGHAGSGGVPGGLLNRVG